MNKRMNLPNMQKILMEFEKQNERMEMTSDMMGDAIDDAMEVGMGMLVPHASVLVMGSYSRLWDTSILPMHCSHCNSDHQTSLWSLG